VPYQELRGEPASESSAGIRARVEAARAVQQARGYYGAWTAIIGIEGPSADAPESGVSAEWIRRICLSNSGSSRFSMIQIC